MVRIYGRGTPGWRQVNVNGFGDRWVEAVTSFATFDGALYAGAGYRDTGGHLWRMDASGSWTPVTVNGFGNPLNQAVADLTAFGGRLYASTVRVDPDWQGLTGGQIWRAPAGGVWEPVVSDGFGNASNSELEMGVFSNTLYAATWSYTATTGIEIWRSPTGDSGDWERVVSNGFGDGGNFGAIGLTAFDNALYVGTANRATGGQVWRSVNGSDWAQVNASGYYTSANMAVLSFQAFGGALYAGTFNMVSGAEVWRCTSPCAAPGDWTQVMSGGFGDPKNGQIPALMIFKDALYAATSNYSTGMEVWRTTDGIHWNQVGQTGFGDSNNATPYGPHSMVVLNSRLYVGTMHQANSGGQVWVKTLTADFTASPVRGLPPLQVQFTNTSGGDFSTSLWDFGDGDTSTETNPQHIYTQSGRYTVTLTIGDGLETSTLTRTNAVQAGHWMFTPLVMRK